MVLVKFSIKVAAFQCYQLALISIRQFFIFLLISKLSDSIFFLIALYDAFPTSLRVRFYEETYQSAAFDKL